MKHINTLLLSILMLMPFMGYAEEILVRTPNGDCHQLQVTPQTTVADLHQHILSLMDEQERALLENPAFSEGEDGQEVMIDLFLDYSLLQGQYPHRAAVINRSYEAGLTDKNREDIAFVVNTLGYNNWIAILRKKGKLDATKTRLITVHPFRFLECIFADERLKVGARNIRKSGGPIWSGFMDGVIEGCGEESAKGNLNQYIDQFAKSVKIDPVHIRDKVEAKNWYGLVEALIKYIPREGDTNRYDM